MPSADAVRMLAAAGRLAEARRLARGGQLWFMTWAMVDEPALRRVLHRLIDQRLLNWCGGSEVRQGA